MRKPSWPWDPPPRPQTISTHYLAELLGIVLKNQEKILANQEKMMATLADTLALVTAEDTTIDSVVVLIQGLRDQIASAGLSAADQAKVDAIFAQATADQAKLNTALTANVPTPTP